MTDPQWDIQVATSFLVSLEEAFVRRVSSEEYFFPILAEPMVDGGDLALALLRAKRAEANGTSAAAVYAMAKELEGRICAAVTATKDGERERWRARSTAAFREAARIEPTPMRWYRLGLSCGDKAEALRCMTQAEAMAEGELKLEAAKMGDRLRSGK